MSNPRVHVQESGVVCPCGHSLVEHADSGWGPQTVCTHQLDDENAGWYGVCPCVVREPEPPDA